jgi:hypothetical protein
MKKLSSYTIIFWAIFIAMALGGLTMVLVGGLSLAK